MKGKLTNNLKQFFIFLIHWAGSAAPLIIIQQLRTQLRKVSRHQKRWSLERVARIIEIIGSPHSFRNNNEVTTPAPLLVSNKYFSSCFTHCRHKGWLSIVSINSSWNIIIENWLEIWNCCLPRISMRMGSLHQEELEHSIQCSPGQCSVKLGTWVDWEHQEHSLSRPGTRGSCLWRRGCPPCPRTASSRGCTPCQHTFPPWWGSAGWGWWWRGPRWSRVGWQIPQVHNPPRPSLLYNCEHHYTLRTNGSNIFLTLSC